MNVYTIIKQDKEYQLFVVDKTESTEYWMYCHTAVSGRRVAYDSAIKQTKMKIVIVMGNFIEN